MGVDGWGGYLARGATALPGAFPFSNNPDLAVQQQWAQVLRTRGWMVLELPVEWHQVFYSWEKTYQEVFSLDMVSKQQAGLYRSVLSRGASLSVGLKKECDGQHGNVSREFIECRMTSHGIPEPTYPSCSSFNDITRDLFRLLTSVSSAALKAIARDLGVPFRRLIELTDCATFGILKEQEEDKDQLVLSSSLLRICLYPFPPAGTTSQPLAQFGAHTDTTLLTVALHTTQPGLELQDQLSGCWICPEEVYSASPSSSSSSSFVRRPLVTVFIGDFLQLLSKHRYQACVHRVCTRRPVEAAKHWPGRLSCPLLVRGLDQQVLQLFTPLSAEEGGEEEEEGAARRRKALVAQLDGERMAVLHRLLDLMRQKCFRRQQEQEGEEEWILRAFSPRP